MDSEERAAFEITKPLTVSYQREVGPYEIIVDSISLQNKQLYELEKQYVAMKDQMEELKEVSENEEQLLANRKKQRILERKLFAEEALIINEKKYDQEYCQKRKELEEEIDLLQDQISIQGDGKINIFMNLSEGLLNQLLEENHRNEQVSSNVKYWKDTYERSKKSV